MGNNSTTLYSFVIKGPASEEDIKSFVDQFNLEYSISKSFIDDSYYNITLSGSCPEDTEILIKVSHFIEECSNHNTSNKKGFITFKSILTERWNKANI